MKEKSLIAGVIVAVVLSGLAFLNGGKTVETVIQKTVGANPGPEVTDRQYFRGGLSVGGNVATTTSKAAYTLQASDLAAGQSVWQVTPNVELALALSATATQKLVPKVGDVAEVIVRNASSTAASAITLSAVDANIDLQFGEATGGDLVLNGLDWGKLTIIRTGTYLVTVIFDEFTEAD